MPPPNTCVEACKENVGKQCTKACTECVDMKKTCNDDGTCNKGKKKWMCVKTCNLSDACKPSPTPSPVPSPGPQCEGLKDVTKKGKNKCKLVDTCSTKKITKKCKKGCKKDVCKKLKKNGTCKKKGKRLCPKTCCDAVGPN